jgi:two-component system phosphate regulon response regulator PhoB
MPPTILVCDDEDVLRALVRASLNGDYAIVEARDGDESLELARHVQPDLVIVDMMMPGRTGLDVVTELRRDAAFAATPVIMLTARAQAADREAANDAGVDRYVQKPFSPLELSATVDELLGRDGDD